jgi:uncharacterized protein (TIGR03067 family)
MKLHIPLPDIELLQGRWKAEMLTCRDQAAPLCFAEMEFRDHELRVTHGDERVDVQPIELIPNSKPGRMKCRLRITEQQNERVVEHLLYEVDKFTLRLCWDTERDEFPKDISETRACVLTLSRCGPPPAEKVDPKFEPRILEHPFLGVLIWDFPQWKGQAEYTPGSSVELSIHGTGSDDTRHVVTAERLVRWLSHSEPNVRRHIASKLEPVDDYGEELTRAELIDALALYSLEIDERFGLAITLHYGSKGRDLFGGHPAIVFLDTEFNTTGIEVLG